MPYFKRFPTEFRDERDSDEESQAWRIMEPDEQGVPQMTPKWYKHEDSKNRMCVVRIPRLGFLRFSTATEDLDAGRRAKKSSRQGRCLIALLVLGLLGAAAAITYIALVTTLIQRLSPPNTSSGLHLIASSWKEPDIHGAFKPSPWPDDNTFSHGIVPKNCHSHNDYWRSAPLYSALAAGCTSVEADVWLSNTTSTAAGGTTSNDLLVAHSHRSTTPHRTLRTLYLDPLSSIFAHRNISTTGPGAREIGIYDNDPSASITLLIDLKHNGRAIFPVLLDHLQLLRARNWLTYVDGATQTRVQGPLTVVMTGDAPSDLIVNSGRTDRFVFLDAPLTDVANPAYNATNSDYASAKLSRAIGHVWPWGLSVKQQDLLLVQIRAAADKGLKSRYWGTPSWPVSLRADVWFALTNMGVGVLNVDDLVSATRWNWNWCVVAGLALCGHR